MNISDVNWDNEAQAIEYITKRANELNESVYTLFNGKKLHADPGENQAKVEERADYSSQTQYGESRSSYIARSGKDYP